MAKKKTSVIQVMITGDAKDLQKATGQGASALGALGGAAISAAASVISGMASIAGAAVAAATQYETAFTGVTKTVNGTTEQLQELSDGIRELSRRIPNSAVEIASVAEAAGQLGIQREAILGFSEVMLQLGATTNLTADVAATQLARLAQITQMPQDEFDRLGATIVDLGNNFATTEAEIVEMGLGMAGAGNIVGMTEHQILGLSTALSSIGIEAEAGGSSMMRVLLDMQEAVNKGGAATEAFARIAGVSASEFATAFKTDAAGALEDFILGLQRVQESGGDVNAALQSVGFTEVRVRRALLGLTGAGDLLTRTLDIGSRAWEENTALSIEAQKRYDTFASQLAIVKNNLVDLGIELGNVFLPYLKTLSQWLIDNRDGIREFFEGGIAKISELTAIAVEKGAEFKKAFDEDYSGSVDNFREAMLTAWETAFPALSDIAEVARTFVTELVTAINEGDAQAVGEALGNLISSAVREGVDLVQLLGDVINEQVEKQGGWYEIGKKAAVMGSQFVVGLIAGIFSAENMSAIVSTIKENPTDILVAALGLGALPTKIVGALAAALRAIPIVGPVLSWFTTGFATVGRQLWRPITSMFAGLRVGFSQGWARFSTSVGDDVARLGQTASGAVDKTVPAIKSAWSRWFAGVGEWVGTRFGLLRSTIGLQKDAAVAALSKFASDFWKVGKDWIQGMINGAGSLGTALINKARSLARNALNAIKNVLDIRSPSGEMMLVGMDMMRGMAIGLDKGSGLVLEMLEDFGAGSLNAAVSVPELPAGVGARGAVYNTINVSGAIDPEGTARTILRVLQDSERRTGARL